MEQILLELAKGSPAAAAVIVAVLIMARERSKASEEFRATMTQMHVDNRADREETRKVIEKNTEALQNLTIKINQL